MTVREAVKEIKNCWNPQRALWLAKVLRHKGGLDYEGSVQFVESKGISRQEWEAMLLEAEAEG